MGDGPETPDGDRRQDANNAPGPTTSTGGEGALTGRHRQRVHRLAVGVGLPVLGAGCLAGLVFSQLPTNETAGWIVHPALVTGLCWVGVLWVVGFGHGRHRPDGDSVRRIVGLANALTVLRGGLYAVVAGFVVVPASTDLTWVPAVCYGTGVLLDFLDGTVARTIGTETELGRRLDMAFDTFGFVAAPLVAVLWGLLPVWYLTLSAARYVYLGGLAWRRVRDLPVFDRPGGDLATSLAGVQMAFITVALVPGSPTGLVHAVAPVVLAPSLVVFTRDYLVASGRLGRHPDDSH